ncbi:biopolymer transporter ExbB [Rubellimicrobium aerolatum]|uniref:Biopolymer transporter ExbB n=1 Tax=Rubellimicrobium aerolatum TaxID=490979 RepID=A0ABW0SDQ0_9RHOB|nr:biopolymer transporter ExbB [Rubellimicrobium aerolatum]MBP1805733.1 DNA-binding transcriptional MerR regulator [Rubellimicrobium aerolatum]
MERRDTDAARHFSQPVRQISLMLIVLALVLSGAYLGARALEQVFNTNVYLNTAIAVVFALGVFSCFRQVFLLMRSVSWIEDFTAHPGQPLRAPPSLLAPLANLLRTRGARMQLTSTSTRSILDSVATRVDEDQEITRYLSSTLIFLGLLGTFYGLATTVPALVDTIRGLTPQEGETGADIFGRLQTGLESQLGGMGTAFSSSLLGLAGSLIVGLLELFAGHGQGRFYRELEEWLSSITRVGLSGEDGGTADSSILGQVVDTMAEQMESLQRLFTQSDLARAQTDRRLGDLAVALGQLAQRLEERDTAPALQRLVEGQDRMVAALDRLNHQMSEGGADAESRMRLRSIDVQLLRILEEISAGRQETLAELRTDLANLARTLRAPARVRDETR